MEKMSMEYHGEDRRRGLRALIAGDENYKEERLPIYVGGAGVMVYDPSKKIFLMMERSDGQGWSLAGGKKDGEETSRQTACRELMEETGIVVNESELIYCGPTWSRCMIKGVYSWVNSEIYKLPVDSTKVNVILAPREFNVYRWMDIAHFLELTNIYEPSLVALNKYCEILNWSVRHAV